MSRNTLCRKIRSQNNRLHVRQVQFSLINEQSMQALKKYSPYLVVGAGLLAGVVARGVGLRRVYSLLRTGGRLYSFMISRHGSQNESNENG